MIFQHPDRIKHPNKKVISRRHHLTIHQLIRDGWVDITPPRSPKQIEGVKLWRSLGDLTRTRANLRQIFSNERGTLRPEQIKALNQAEIVLQQLIKKHNDSLPKKK